MEQQYQQRAYRRGRQMYVIEAALEYLISILVSGSFLATLTGYLGIPDSLTGILSSIISLGCVFQLLSILIQRKRVKPLVIGMSILNQLLFLSLFLIPLLPIGQKGQILLFVAVILLAYLVYNLVSAPKTVWLMSLVEDRKRGSFTAGLEIFSLITGMIFTFLMGVLVDHFAEAGQMRAAFLLTALVVLCLTILHTVTLLLTIEPKENAGSITSVNLSDLMRTPALRRITPVFILYNMAIYVATPFYGTYQINELGFSLKLVSVLVILGSVVRMLVSRFWGRYADHHSFAVMVEKCFLILGAAALCAALATPSNGIVMFALYYIFQGIAYGGINSAMTNMIFDYIAPEKRSASLAISRAVSGLIGFLTTIAISPLISSIQNNGSRFLGLSVYAQQVVSAISLVILFAATAYVHFIVIRRCSRISR